MKCIKCGTVNQANTKFCTKCGTPLKKGSVGKSIAILILLVFIFFFVFGIIATATGSELLQTIRIALPILALLFGIPIIIVMNSLKK